jgi:Ser/Thr protein kinase RdoA (MazF antagonist)
MIVCLRIFALTYFFCLIYTEPEKLIGIFDFGDLTYSSTIFEIAIAMAYAMMPTT